LDHHHTPSEPRLQHYLCCRTWSHRRLVTLRDSLGRRSLRIEHFRIQIIRSNHGKDISHENVTVDPTVLQLTISFPFHPQLLLTRMRPSVGNPVNLIFCCLPCHQQGRRRATSLKRASCSSKNFNRRIFTLLYCRPNVAGKSSVTCALAASRTSNRTNQRDVNL